MALADQADKDTNTIRHNTNPLILCASKLVSISIFILLKHSSNLDILQVHSIYDESLKK